MNVDITGVDIGKNPASFTDPFQFKVSFQCVKPITEGTLFIDILYFFILFDNKTWNGKLYI